MNIEEKRMQLWLDVYYKYIGNYDHDASEMADTAMHQFDKRFFAQVEIKETGDLGIILDTERPWIHVEVDLPKAERNVEVMFADGTTDLGWMGKLGTWFTKQASLSVDSYYWTPSIKPVIAWRELPIKTEE